MRNWAVVAACLIAMASAPAVAQTEPEPKRTPPAAAEGAPQPKRQEDPSPTAPPKEAKPATDMSAGEPASAEPKPASKPAGSGSPSAVFQPGRPRHFLARFHGEVIGRLFWDARMNQRGGGVFERAERDFFLVDPQRNRFRCNYVERQQSKSGTFDTMWCTLRDVQFGGQFQLKGTGESATTRLLTSEGGAPQDTPFPTPADYRPATDIAAWCANYRGATGKTYAFSRPLWFSRGLDWGEVAITVEGADPVVMEDGGTVQAWRYRVRFAGTPQVYALLWLDAGGLPVRRDLPFCGLSFVGCSEAAYNEVSKIASWKEVQSRWQLPDDRMTAEILFLVHDHLEKERAEGSSWGGGLAPEDMLGSDDEAEAKLGLFLFFL